MAILSSAQDLKLYASFYALPEVVGYISDCLSSEGESRKRIEAMKPNSGNKVELRGNDIFVFEQSYETKASELLKFESHRDFIDIQLAIVGFEFIDVEAASRLEVDTPYNSQTDYEGLIGNESYTRLLLRAGDFAVFYPNEAHKPGVTIADSALIRKAVIKVRAEILG